MARRRSSSPDSDAYISPVSPSPTYKPKKYESKSRPAKTPIKSPRKSRSREKHLPTAPSITSSVYPDSELPLHDEPRKSKPRKSGQQRDQSPTPTRERRSARDKNRHANPPRSARTPDTDNPYTLSPESPFQKHKSSKQRVAEPESPHVRIKTPVKSPNRTKKDQFRYASPYNTAADFMNSGNSADADPPRHKRAVQPYLQPIRTQQPMGQQRDYPPQQRPFLPTQESILHLSNGQPPANRMYAPQRQQQPQQQQQYQQQQPHQQQQYQQQQQNQAFFQQETSYNPGPYMPSPNPYAPSPAMTNVPNNVPPRPGPRVDRSTKANGWFGAIRNPFDDSNQYDQLQNNDPFAQAEQGPNENQQPEKIKKTLAQRWTDFKHKKLVMWAAISLFIAALLGVGLYFAITKSTAHKRAGTSPTGGASQPADQMTPSRGSSTGNTGNTGNTDANPFSNLDPAIASRIAPPTAITNAVQAQNIAAEAVEDSPMTFNVLSSSDGGRVNKRANKKSTFSAFSHRDEPGSLAENLKLGHTRAIHKRANGKSAFNAFGGRDESGHSAEGLEQRDTNAVHGRSNKKSAFSAFGRRNEPGNFTDGLSMRDANAVHKRANKKPAFSAFGHRDEPGSLAGEVNVGEAPNAGKDDKRSVEERRYRLSTWTPRGARHPRRAYPADSEGPSGEKTQHRHHASRHTERASPIAERRTNGLSETVTLEGVVEGEDASSGAVEREDEFVREKHAGHTKRGQGTDRKPFHAFSHRV